MSLTLGADADDRIVVPSSAGILPPTAQTIMLWVYPTTLTASRRYFAQGGTGYSNEIDVGLTTSELDCTACVRATTDSLAVTSGAGITTNKWWCIVLTDDLTDGPRIFLGDLTTRLAEVGAYATRQTGVGAPKTTGDTGVVVGNIVQSGGALAFRGRIAFAGRWRRRMTLAELRAQQYNPHVDVDSDIFMWPGSLIDTSQAIAHDASSESHTGTAGSASEASFTWNHAAASANVKGILVFTFTQANADDATSVTYGGVSMTAVSGGRAVDTAGEPGDCKAWLLSSDSIPQGTQAVVVNRNNNANVMYAVAISILGSYPIEVVEGSITLQQTDGTLAEVSIPSKARSAIRYAGMNSGLAAIVDNPTTPGTNNLSRGANSTALHDLDVGARVIQVVRETTGGTGSRSTGFSASTSDDRAGVYLALAQKITDLNYARGANGGGSNGAIHGCSQAPNVPLWLPPGVEVGVSGT